MRLLSWPVLMQDVLDGRRVEFEVGMPTLFLICGLPGAGKTTLAKRLEQERRALRLTPDDWMMALGIDLCDESKRAAIEALQWTFAERTLTLGVDTILDFGFWSRIERDDFRRQANAVGASVEVRFLDLPGDELCGAAVEAQQQFGVWRGSHRQGPS